MSSVYHIFEVTVVFEAILVGDAFFWLKAGYLRLFEESLEHFVVQPGRDLFELVQVAEEVEPLILQCFEIVDLFGEVGQRQVDEGEFVVKDAVVLIF
jgi:hypothetical protein